MTTQDIASARGRCWSCGYRLDAITSHRCPECGKPFDPDNPRTMNMRNTPGRVGRWALAAPVGPITVATAFASTVMILATTRMPVGPVDLSLADIRYLLPWGKWFEFWRHAAAHPWSDILFVAAMELWAILLTTGIIRVFLQRLYGQRYKPAVKPLPLRQSAAYITLLFLSSVLIPVGADFRLANDWLETARLPRTISPLGWDYRQTFHPGLSTPHEDDLLRLALRQSSPRDRMLAAAIVVETRADRGLPLLLEACKHESHPDVKSGLLMLIAMYRDPATADLFTAAMDDSALQVRIAAADALGILHAPAYPIPFPNNGWSTAALYKPQVDGRAALPIALAELVEYSITAGTPRASRTSTDHLRDAPLILPEKYRQRLTQMMMGAATPDEREAAARALVLWPSQSYALRLAEWGVWVDDNGQLKLVQSLLDEIPPMVHRLGNTNAELRSRVNAIRIIFKPVIHLTTSTPMAADINIDISNGRPWYAYPEPDDFTVRAADFRQFKIVLNPDGSRKLDAKGIPSLEPVFPTLTGLDPPLAFACLDNGRQGYPGIFPEHPMSGSISGGMTSHNDIAAVGLRWQSVIVSPELPKWATLAPVAADPKFDWWNRLRKVPTSYVISRGEAERFLYYDGPTVRPSPVTAALVGDVLTLKSIVLDDSPPSPAELPPANTQTNPFPRAALFIRVREGKATALLLPNSALDVAGTIFRVPSNFSNDAPALLLKLLTDAGLTPDEAAGLIDAWRPQFFQTNGDRLITRFSSADYDTLCPLRMQPAPTQLARVGLLLTEFGNQ